MINRVISTEIPTISIGNNRQQRIPISPAYLQLLNRLQLNHRNNKFLQQQRIQTVPLLGNSIINNIGNIYNSNNNKLACSHQLLSLHFPKFKEQQPRLNNRQQRIPLLPTLKIRP